MSIAAVRTSLMFTLAQIVEGDVTCSACDRAAVVTTANGADPEPEPFCGEHAAQLLDLTRAVCVDLFGFPPPSLRPRPGLD